LPIKEATMTLTQIEYILAVAKEKSFRKAAKSRFVSQPTLSAQIQKLEEELGVVIFDRSQSTNSLTKIGELIIHQAKMVKDEADRVSEIVQVQKYGLVGELNVGAIPTISPYLIPIFLDSFNKKYPKLALNLSELTTENCLNHLVNEEIDVAILATSEDKNIFYQEKLYDEEMVLFSNKDNKLLKKKSISTNDISAEEIWLLEEGHCLRDEIIKICGYRNERSKYPKNLKFQVGNLESLRLLVQANFGYTLLPYLSTLKLNPKEKKLLRPFSGHKPQRSIYLTLRKGYLKEAAVKAVKAEILSSIPFFK